MQSKQTMILIATGILALSSTGGRAETPAEWFAKGEKSLAQGEFTAALEYYAAAARADRNNPEYIQHYTMVRRVVDLRTMLQSEKDPQRWEYLTKALRAFYLSELIYPEMLGLDQRVHARLNSAASAIMLADTQLALDRNAEAVETLSSLEPGRATEMAQSLLGIALTRTGKVEQAKKIAEKLSAPANASPGVTYAAARLHAATGNSAKALEVLRACFETTLPSQLEGFKSHAKLCPEFAALAMNPDFARVLETKSKVPESKCSGGSSCAGCPMAGKCPRSQGKQ